MEKKDINGIPESWYKKQLNIQIKNLNMFDEKTEDIIKNIRIINIHDKTIKNLAKYCRESYESSFPNVKIIPTFEFPKNYAYMSNFNFGKMFGKTELILKILERS